MMTKHHVPPRSVAPTEFILLKTWREHSAYHTIFGNASSFEECVKILRLYWWTPQNCEDATVHSGSRHRKRGGRSLRSRSNRRR